MTILSEAPAHPPAPNKKTYLPLFNLTNIHHVSQWAEAWFHKNVPCFIIESPKEV